MFKDALLIALLILAGAVGGFSQSRFELDFGARAGLPFDISMESRLSGVASLSSVQAFDRSPFSVGPTFTVLYDRVRVELDALYKPIREWNTSRLAIRSEVRYTKWHKFGLLQPTQVEVSVGISLGHLEYEGAGGGGVWEEAQWAFPNNVHRSYEHTRAFLIENYLKP